MRGGMAFDAWMVLFVFALYCNIIAVATTTHELLHFIFDTYVLMRPITNFYHFSNHESASEVDALDELWVTRGREGAGERRALKMKSNRNGKDGASGKTPHSVREKTCWCFGPL